MSDNCVGGEMSGLPVRPVVLFCLYPCSQRTKRYEAKDHDTHCCSYPYKKVGAVAGLRSCLLVSVLVLWWELSPLSNRWILIMDDKFPVALYDNVFIRRGVVPSRTRRQTGAVVPLILFYLLLIVNDNVPVCPVGCHAVCHIRLVFRV